MEMSSEEMGKWARILRVERKKQGVWDSTYVTSCEQIRQTNLKKGRRSSTQG